MHPHQIQRIITQHHEELRTQAHQARLNVQRPGRRNSVRHRAGWTLIEVGLRLAGTSDDG
jgi:hypothetical protein